MDSPEQRQVSRKRVCRLTSVAFLMWKAGESTVSRLMIGGGALPDRAERDKILATNRALYGPRWAMAPSLLVPGWWLPWLNGSAPVGPELLPNLTIHAALFESQALVRSLNLRA